MKLVTMLKQNVVIPSEASRRSLITRVARVGLRSRGISLRSFLFVVAALLLIPSASQAKGIKIEKFQSQVAVLPDASVNITETIGVHFIGTGNHGLYRDIPVEYVTPQQMNYSLFVTITRVTDGSGHNLKYESSRVRHYLHLKIFVPDADDSDQTVNIQYTVSDALRFFEDHDEFYWNITGDEWDVPIGNASASISLPAEAKNIRANVFTGAYRSTGKNAEAEIAGNGVEVHTTVPLGYHEGLTVAVAFDKGAVQEPGAVDKLALFFRSNWPLFLPILVFAFMFWLWWTRGRDPRLRPIAAQYEPPDKLTPSEAGTLVDNSCDMRDITAAIVDLAVRGYLVIQENTQEHMMGLWQDKDYNFILKKPRGEWTPLKPHEIALLDGIFDDGTVGETVAMSSLHNVFYRSLPIIKSQIFGSLISSGYYLHRPDTVRASYLGGGLLFGFLAIAFGGAIGANLGLCRYTGNDRRNPERRHHLRLRLVHARAHGNRHARPRRRPRLRGFSRSRRIRPLQSHGQNSRNV